MNFPLLPSSIRSVAALYLEKIHSDCIPQYFRTACVIEVVGPGRQCTTPNMPFSSL